MTKIIAPFADLGPRRAEVSVEAEYVQAVADALIGKFAGAQVEASPNGAISVAGQIDENIRYDFTVFLSITIESMVEAAVSGGVYGDILVPAMAYEPQSGDTHQSTVVSIPFNFAKDVFKEDDPAILADFIYTTVSSHIKQAHTKFLEKTQ